MIKCILVKQGDQRPETGQDLLRPRPHLEEGGREEALFRVVKGVQSKGEVNNWEAFNYP